MVCLKQGRSICISIVTQEVNDEKKLTQAGGASLTPLQIKGNARKGVTDA